MKLNMLLTTMVAFVAFVSGVLANPLYREFEPTTEDRKQVLLEIFDAIFVPTPRPSTSLTSHSIRGHLEELFGYVSRSGVDYVLASLGYIRGVDLDEMEASLHSSTAATMSYKHYCRIPAALNNRMTKAETVEDWLSAIENKTGRALTVTRQYLAEHPADY